MIPPITSIKMWGTLADQQVTRVEVAEIVSSVFNTAIFGVALAVSMAIVLKAVGANPGNPDSVETEKIVERAGLGEYRPPRFIPREEEPERVRRRRPPAVIRTRDVWIYRIVMEKRDDRCRIKLYEYISGWGSKLKAVWSGEGPYCDVKFEEISDTIRQVEFEYKTAMRAALRR